METTLDAELHKKLLALPFDGYLCLIGMLLEKLGYQSVQLAGRNDWKGRNQAGGFDLTATLPGGVSPRPVVIQAKQFDAGARVFQRQVDELRGVAIRSHASEAVLVTTGLLSNRISRSSLAMLPMPVRLIGKDDLLALLESYHIGVRADGTLDTALFDQLTRQAQGNGRGDFTTTAGQGTKVRNQESSLLLKVELIATPQSCKGIPQKRAGKLHL